MGSNPALTANVNHAPTSSVAPIWPTAKAESQTSSAPDQFAESQQANQTRKPGEDVTAVADERAADQRVQVAVRQIVQVGTHLAHHDIVYARTKFRHRKGNGDERHSVERGDAHRRGVR